MSFIFIVLSAVFARAELSSDMVNAYEGVWQLRGVHSVRGPYSGQVEFRLNYHGDFNVTRVLEYSDYKYRGFKVQEVMTGLGTSSLVGQLDVTFNLKKANFVTRATGADGVDWTRSPQDFRESVALGFKYSLAPTVNANASQIDYQVISNDASLGFYQDHLEQRKPTGADPIWLNQRVELRSNYVMDWVKKEILNFTFRSFQKDPAVHQYSSDKKFKDPNPKFVHDPTDYAFYRRNPLSLRVDNQVIDVISLEEALLRRDAYAFSLAEKAQSIDSDISNYQSELGLPVKLVKNSDSVISSPEDDGAFLLGMYISAQAVRFRLTQEREALEIIRKSIQALYLLLDVPPAGMLARNVVKGAAPSEPRGFWHLAGDGHENMSWLDGASVAHFQSVAQALLLSYLVVPDEEVDLKNSIREHARKLMNLKILETAAYNRQIAYGVVAYICGDAEAKKSYKRMSYNPKIFMLDRFDPAFFIAGMADWDGLNLRLHGMILEILVADLNGDSSRLKLMREQLMRLQKIYALSQRSLLTIAAYTFALKDESKSAYFDADLWDRSVFYAKWGLREIPIIRESLHVEIDRQMGPGFVLSPYPRMVHSKWLPLYTEGTNESRYQGLLNYPAFEQDGLQSSFLWSEDPFQYKAEFNGVSPHARVDYLYAYWMARYSGFISDQD